MKPVIVFAFATMAFATSSAAQSGPVAQQSSDQLICQLSGDCANSGTEATRDKPASRGFSIARPGQKAATTTAVSVPTPSRTGVTNARLRTPAATAPQAGRFAVVRPNSADLMISFVSGSAQLTEQAKANAEQFVIALASPKLASMKFAIEGHTDAVGNRPYNLDLSQRRAQAVVDFLNSKGADKSRFSVKGYGFDRPIVRGNPRAPANRRVEVVKVN